MRLATGSHTSTSAILTVSPPLVHFCGRMLGARRCINVPGVRHLTSDANGGGFWKLWKEQEDDRRARWEEGRQVRAAHLENERQQWERIRESWRHLGESREEKEQQRQSQQQRGRITWWWEDPAAGTRRASAEDIKKFAERNFGGRNTGQASRGEPRVPRAAAVSDSLSHYAALGLHSDTQRRCPPQELRSAFERVAKATHPDTAAAGDGIAPPSAAAVEQRTQRFRRAKAAYDFLRDEERRRLYDGT